jgi:hypothetical protein
MVATPFAKQRQGGLVRFYAVFYAVLSIKFCAPLSCIFAHLASTTAPILL